MKTCLPFDLTSPFSEISMCRAYHVLFFVYHSVSLKRKKKSLILCWGTCDNLSDGAGRSTCEWYKSSQPTEGKRNQGFNLSSLRQMQLLYEMDRSIIVSPPLYFIGQLDRFLHYQLKTPFNGHPRSSQPWHTLMPFFFFLTLQSLGIRQWVCSEGYKSLKWHDHFP